MFQQFLLANLLVITLQRLAKFPLKWILISIFLTFGMMKVYKILHISMC